MNKYNPIAVNGFWNDNQQPFFNMMVSTDSWDEIEDEDDSYIFYYTDGEPILGDHGDFTITEITGEI